MGAALDDIAVVEHENFVGAHNGREPVRDDQRGAVPRHAFELVLNVFFGVAVERRSRLVEQKDRRAFQDRARNRHPLFLAAGKFQAALADLGLIALPGARLDETVDLRLARRFLDFGGIACVPAPIADVVADGKSLNSTVSCGTIPIEAYADDVWVTSRMSWPSIKDAAAADIVETEQEPRDGRFASARRPDNGDGMTGGDVEAQALEDRPLRVIGKRDILEADGACRSPRSAGAPGRSSISGFFSITLNMVSISISACLISR